MLNLSEGVIEYGQEIGNEMFNDKVLPFIVLHFKHNQSNKCHHDIYTILGIEEKLWSALDNRLNELKTIDENKNYPKNAFLVVNIIRETLKKEEPQSDSDDFGSLLKGLEYYKEKIIEEEKEKIFVNRTLFIVRTVMSKLNLTKEQAIKMLIGVENNEEERINKILSLI